MEKTDKTQEDVICTECKQKIYRTYFHLSDTEKLCNECLRKKYMREVPKKEV